MLCVHHIVGLAVEHLAEVPPNQVYGRTAARPRVTAVSAAQAMDDHVGVVGESELGFLGMEQMVRVVV